MNIKFNSSNLFRFWNITLIILLSINISNAQGFWTAVTIPAPDPSIGGFVVLTDGTVLCKTASGGSDGIGNIWDKLTPDNHGSYINGTWSQIAPMASTRLFFSTQMLMDGRVYVAGGEYGTDGYQAGAHSEVYDPLTNVWTACPSAGHVISDANSEILPDGTVLQALVASNLKITALYNPATNTYIPGPSCLGIHNESMWVKLPDNSILFVNRGSTSSERYIPSTNTWVADATVPVNLYSSGTLETGPGFLLPDGRVFFFGGTSHTAYYTPSGTTSPGTWLAGPDIPNGQVMDDAGGAMMVNGIILVGVDVPSENPPTTFYEFNYLTNTFTQVGAPGGGNNLNISSYQTCFVDLPNGQVLYASGQDITSNQYYVYTPSGSPLSAGKPTISNITQSGCGSFTITGTLFNGISEGAAYGDDWQMESNYPLVRLTSGGNVYYARTSNWNRTSVQTGNLADTAQFTVPLTLPHTAYYLVVEANGIASDSILFYPWPILSSSLTPPSICSNTAFTYTPTSYDVGATFTWTRAAVAGISNSAITIPQVTNPNEVLINTTANPVSVVYSYIITANGCSDTEAITVVVNPLPIPVITGNTQICMGDSTTLTVTNGASYSWSNSSTNNSITVSPITITTYSVTVTNTYGCTGTTSHTVAVNQLPVVDYTGLPDSVCSNSGSITLAGNPTGGTFSGNGITGNNFDPNSLSGNDTITYSYTDSLGCTNNHYHIINVLVSPSPAVSITGSATFCQGGSVTLSAGNYVTYSWSNAATTDSITTTTGGTYTVTVSGSNGCTGTASQLITVNSNPTPTITSNGPDTFCFGDSVILSSGNYSSYGWSNSSTAGTITVNSSGNYIVTVTDGNGCMGTATQSVLVNQLPVVSFTGLPDTMCVYGGNKTLTASPTGGTFSGSGLTLNIFNPTSLANGNYTITYTYTDSNGCVNSLSHVIYVSPCTGIQELSMASDGMNLYPNPAVNEVTVSFFSDKNESYSILMNDILGRTVKSEIANAVVGINERVFGLNGISKGVYIVTLKTGDGIINKKIVIE